MQTVLWTMTSAVIGVMLACTSQTPQLQPTVQVVQAAVETPASPAHAHTAAAERTMFRSAMAKRLDALGDTISAMEKDVRLGGTAARISAVAGLRRAHRVLTLALAQVAAAPDEQWPRAAAGLARSIGVLQRGVEAAQVMDDFSVTGYPARI
ncbi:MAG TPA: hypothetical protein VFL95_11925 [Gemmatimonadales bacterium]|nr:hypothetical protein [Gemmatimonadales bacterium]